VELRQKAADVQAAEERFKQIKERLERRPEGAGPTEQRLQQLERKVELLQKELEALRKQQAKRLTPIDLQAKANHQRKDDFHSGRYPGNKLASLPGGEQTLDGIQFPIGRGQ